MRLILSCLTLLLFSACDTQSKEKSLSINGFDWSGKKVVILQPELNEISGIVYDRNSNSFLAINDEQGKLFVLNPADLSIRQKLKFGPKGDYECVAINGNQVFVLNSNGDIYAMRYEHDSISSVSTTVYSGPATEFESTLWDNQKNTLQLISKKSEADKEIQANNIYSYNPATGTYALDTRNRISWDAIRSKGTTIKAFRPSGAAIQPGTGNIFVVASIEKLLVIFSPDWQVLTVHHLDEKLFRQPEGITFDREGNLLITNEAADVQPTLIFIPIKK